MAARPGRVHEEALIREGDVLHPVSTSEILHEAHHSLGEEAAPVLTLGAAAARGDLGPARAPKPEVVLEIDERVVDQRQIVHVFPRARRALRELLAPEPGHARDAGVGAAGAEGGDDLREGALPRPHHAGVDETRGEALRGPEGGVRPAPEHRQPGTDGPGGARDLDGVGQGRARRRGDAQAQRVLGELGHEGRGRHLEAAVHDGHPRVEGGGHVKQRQAAAERSRAAARRGAPKDASRPSRSSSPHPDEHGLAPRPTQSRPAAHEAFEGAERGEHVGMLRGPAGLRLGGDEQPQARGRSRRRTPGRGRGSPRPPSGRGAAGDAPARARRARGSRPGPGSRHERQTNRGPRRRRPPKRRSGWDPRTPSRCRATRTPAASRWSATRPRRSPKSSTRHPGPQKGPDLLRHDMGEVETDGLGPRFSHRAGPGARAAREDRCGRGGPRQSPGPGPGSPWRGCPLPVDSPPGRRAVRARSGRDSRADSREARRGRSDGAAAACGEPRPPRRPRAARRPATRARAGRPGDASPAAARPGKGEGGARGAATSTASTRSKWPASRGKASMSASARSSDDPRRQHMLRRAQAVGRDPGWRRRR